MGFASPGRRPSGLIPSMRIAWRSFRILSSESLTLERPALAATRRPAGRRWRCVQTRRLEQQSPLSTLQVNRQFEVRPHPASRELDSHIALVERQPLGLEQRRSRRDLEKLRNIAGGRDGADALTSANEAFLGQDFDSSRQGESAHAETLRELRLAIDSLANRG